MISEVFQHWLLSQKIEERSLQRFWAWFEAHQNEVLKSLLGRYGEFVREDLQIEIACIDLSLENWPHYDERYICVYMPMSYKKRFYWKKGEKKPLGEGRENVEEVGLYRLYFDLDGEIKSENVEWYR